jgi:2-polyprenyl-3-methyl-5-hydroxy-6-metoxy-1,4-benzoquinol methylase
MHACTTYAMQLSYCCAAASAAGLLVDASCATGLFTRLFAASGHFSAVVALDYSEAMLRQAGAFIAADKAVAASK